MNISCNAQDATSTHTHTHKHHVKNLKVLSKRRKLLFLKTDRINSEGHSETKRFNMVQDIENFPYVSHAILETDVVTGPTCEPILLLFVCNMAQVLHSPTVCTLSSKRDSIVRCSASNSIWSIFPHLNFIWLCSEVHITLGISYNHSNASEPCCCNARVGDDEVWSDCFPMDPEDIVVTVPSGKSLAITEVNDCKMDIYSLTMNFGTLLCVWCSKCIKSMIFFGALPTVFIGSRGSILLPEGRKRIHATTRIEPATSWL